MDVCKVYPKFEADQVLTAEQLNSLFAFLDDQTRLTRRCFIGAGILCGMKAHYQSVQKAVHVSGGSGLTTKGYAIKVSPTVFTHYREYADPVAYPFFQVAGHQVKLWELLPAGEFDTEDPDNIALTDGFVKNKVLLMYLECEEVDLETCTGDDCDEEGIEVRQCVKALLIEKAVLQILINRVPGPALIPHKNPAPVLDIGRLTWLGDEKTPMELATIRKAYLSLIYGGFLNLLHKALSWSYDNYRPLLSELYAQDPFRFWNPDLTDPQVVQYAYDYVIDLVMAYEEFTNTAFRVYGTCCAPEDSFPKHLMLGDLLGTPACEPDPYRHLFYPSNLADGGGNPVEKVQILFKRLVLLAHSFQVPHPDKAPIRVTPSREKEGPFSKRSIPYYYSEKEDELRLYWDPEAGEKCQTEYILSYASNAGKPECGRQNKGGGPVFGGSDSIVRKTTSGLKGFRETGFRDPLSGVGLVNDGALRNNLIAVDEKNPRLIFGKSGSLTKLPQKEKASFKAAAIARTQDPLSYNIQDYPFYRIEGHLGKNFEQAFKEVSEWIHCYNLPVKLLGLKVGRIFRDIEAGLDCRFEDLEALFATERAKIICQLRKAYAYLADLRFAQPENKYVPSDKTRITGILKDQLSKNPASEIVYEVEGTTYRGRTDKSGQMELSGLPSGEYTLNLYGGGYAGKSFKVQVNDSKELELGEIYLKEEKKSAPVYYKEAPLKYDESSYSYRYTGEQPYATYGSRANIELNLQGKEAGDAFVEYKAPSDSKEIEFLRMAAAKETDANAKEALIREMVAAENTAKEAAAREAVVKEVAAREEMAKAETRKILEEKKTPPSEYAIGTLYEKEIVNAREEDIYYLIEDYLYARFPEASIVDTGVVIDKLYQPIVLLSAINAVVNYLKRPLLQMDSARFESLYGKLLTQVSIFRKKLETDEGKKLFPGLQLLDVLSQLEVLERQSCFSFFEELLKEYARRKALLQERLLLSNYSGKNPGMMHLAGVPAGGTFFLVYDDSHRVVLDFALPYVCCSDCPPIQMCTGIPAVFKLPKETFCKSDETQYKFIVNPPGGAVTGPGVVTDPATGDAFLDLQSPEVVPGILSYTYEYNEAMYDLDIRVVESQVGIRYRVLSVDNDARTAQVEFAAVPAANDAHSWDFGDGNTDETAAPTHTYDISEQTSFDVKLEVKQGLCTATDAATVTLEVCNATFKATEIASDLETVTYAFEPVQIAESYAWQFGDGATSEEPNPTHSYKKGEGSRELVVTLEIQQETCSDSHSEVIEIPGLEEMDVSLPKEAFCIDDTEQVPVTATPEGGKLSGIPLIYKDGQAYFVPNQSTEGRHTLFYDVLGTRVSFSFNVYAAIADFTYNIRAIDSEKQVAEVRFSGPAGMEKYAWQFGDGQTGEEQNPLHVFDLREQTTFGVQLTATRGPCETASEPVSLDLSPCTVDFVHQVVENNGETVEMVFTANIKDAEIYLWHDGEKSYTTTSPMLRATYSLGLANKTREMRLEIKRDVCVASIVHTFELPPAQALTLSLEKRHFAYCDQGTYPISVSSTGGKVTGPGVRESGGQFVFIPSATGISGGTVDLIYTLGTRSVSLTVNIMTPRALFEFDTPVRAGDGTYTLRLFNQSEDANTYQWTVGNQTSKEESPVLQVPAEPGSTVEVVLTVFWDELCPHTAVRKVFIPRQVDPTLPGGGDDVVVRQPGDDLVIGAVDDNLVAMDRLARDERFVETFPETDPVFTGTRDAVNTLKVELQDPNFSKAIASGQRNDVIAETYSPLLEGSMSKVTASSASPEVRDQSYQLALLQFSQLVEVAGMQEKDLARTSALYNTMNQFVKATAQAKASGVDVNPGGALEKLVSKGMEANAGKANVQGLFQELTKIMEA